MPEHVRAGNTGGYAQGDGYLFVVSGRNYNGQITKKNQRYNFGSDTWSLMAEHPTGKMGAASTVLQDSLYTFGGLTTTPGTATRRVYKYSINQDSWSQVAQMPYPIVDADAVTYQDSLVYIVGSYSGNTLLYNAHTDHWRSATPILTSGSLAWGGFAVKDDKLVWACGTNAFLSNTYFNTVRVGTIDQNDRANITWTEAAPFPGNTRTFFDMYPWRDGVILTGGSTDNTFETASNECYHYNVTTDTWTALPPKPTAWNTGNSTSIYIDGQWHLICTAGYANGYLTQTEIFSEQALGWDNLGGCQLKDFRILQAAQTTIGYCSTSGEVVTVTLRDSHGRVIDVQNEPGKMGWTEITMSHTNLPTGIYFYTLQQGATTASKKMIRN